MASVQLHEPQQWLVGDADNHNLMVKLLLSCPSSELELVDRSLREQTPAGAHIIHAVTLAVKELPKLSIRPALPQAALTSVWGTKHI